MMKRTLDFAALLCCLFCFKNTLLAQAGTDIFGGEFGYAMQSLHIKPDAAADALGGTGLATRPSANALYFNPAKLAFAANTSELAHSVAKGYPIYPKAFHYLGMYFRPDSLQAVGASFGRMQYVYQSDIGLPDRLIFENSFAISYARKLNGHFSAGGSLRLLHGRIDEDESYQSGYTNIAKDCGIAGDISFFFTHPFAVGRQSSGHFNMGLAITNLGSRMRLDGYHLRRKLHLPGNVGLGVAGIFHIRENWALQLSADANKLLLPTPTDEDADGNGLPDMYEGSWAKGVFGSFADAPGGFGDELREISISGGVELGIHVPFEKPGNRIDFHVRMGYTHQNEQAGYLRHLTAGTGATLTVGKWFPSLDFSYVTDCCGAYPSPAAGIYRLTGSFGFR